MSQHNERPYITVFAGSDSSQGPFKSKRIIAGCRADSFDDFFLSTTKKCRWVAGKRLKHKRRRHAGQFSVLPRVMLGLLLCCLLSPSFDTSFSTPLKDETGANLAPPLKDETGANLAPSCGEELFKPYYTKQISITPIARLKGCSGNDLGDGPTPETDLPPPLISDDSSSDSEDSSDCEVTPVKRTRTAVKNGNRNASVNRSLFSSPQRLTPQQRLLRAGYTPEKVAEVRAMQTQQHQQSQQNGRDFGRTAEFDRNSDDSSSDSEDSNNDSESGGSGKVCALHTQEISLKPTNNFSDLESLSEISGDDEPTDGDDVISEARSDSEDPNTDDDLFIASEFDSNDSQGSAQQIAANQTNGIGQKYEVKHHSSKRKKSIESNLDKEARRLLKLNARRIADAQRQRQHRADRTPDKSRETRATDIQLRQVLRVNRTPEQVISDRVKNSQQKKAKRHALAPQAQQQVNAARRAKDGRGNVLWREKNKLNIARRFSIDAFEEYENATSYNIGSMSTRCDYCKAWYWELEKDSANKYTRCCQTNTIRLAPMHAPTDIVNDLFIGASRDSKLFLAKARAFNSMCAFASVKIQEDKRLKSTAGIPNFKISGAIYHKLGSAIASPDFAPAFLQCYFYDGDDTYNVFNFSNKEQRILATLRSEIRRVNPFMLTLKDNLDLIESCPNYKIIISDKVPRGEHARVYNAPSVTELAVIIVGDENDGTITKSREVVIRKRGGGLNEIPSNHTSYDPMSYVLTHMHSDKGWTYTIPTYKDSSVNSAVSTSIVTPMEYYSYRLQLRDDKWDKNLPHTHRIGQDILSFGRLLADQYWVDQWVKLEEQRLIFIANNQSKLKQEIYSGLADAVRANETRDAGTYVVLPSSHVGSPRYMAMNFQDAMAIVRKHGKPDLFITFTCNPNWDEIVAELRPGESSWMRKDLTVRVFQMKLKQLLDDLLNKHVLGVPVAHLHVIEFQKRGLPHAHILIILQANDKPRNTDDFDKIICAEIPDPVKHPKLHEIVKSQLMHGPCGARNPNCVCMIDGKCKCHFPKPLQETTTISDDSYPLYRRRGRHTVEKNGVVMTDEWVVPYNPYLALKYNAHINVEICNSITSVKYLYKYVFKGHDKLSVSIVENDHGGGFEVLTPEEQRAKNAVNINEITKYVESRYVSSCEAMWRINGFKMSGIDPNVVRLQIHLPNQQVVTYLPGAEVQALATVKPTTLTAYFTIVADESNRPLTVETRTFKDTLLPSAAELTYAEFPTYYTWCTKNDAWKRRQKPKVSDCVSRIYNIHPSDGEKFYLRLLLHHVKGARDFAALRTVDDFTHLTFLDACKARGLTADDAEWKSCLRDACVYQTPRALRNLFAIIVINNAPTNVLELFHLTIDSTKTLKECMSEDFLYHRKIAANNPLLLMNETDIYECLLALDTYFRELSSGTKNLAFFNLPSVPSDYLPRGGPLDNSLMRQELDYDKATLHEIYLSNLAKMNIDQKLAFEKVRFEIDLGTGANSKMFFLDAPGGTGKTFLFNTILAYYRSIGKICLALASSGIAAILLAGGRTGHSRFKIPLAVNSETTLKVSKRSDLAKLLIASHIIIWDEAPMQSKNVISSVDRLLRFLMGEYVNGEFQFHPEPFGGKVFIFGGDFRQNTPVIPKANRAGVTMQLISKCSWWPDVLKLKLTINERIRRLANSDEQDLNSFSDFLTNIGDGAVPYESDLGEFMIRIPDEFVFQSPNREDFIDWCFPNISRDANVGDRAILTPLNKDADELNDIALSKMTGVVSVHLSVDSVLTSDNDEAMNYPVEFLNTLSLSGMPAHNLKLKIGCPLILLRNLNPSLGLCNGTRLELLSFTSRLLSVKILNGSHQGQTTFIPRIDLMTTDGALPFQMIRRQFPVKLGFAMTINKAQGQSLSQVGIYLPNPVFSHGQLYVALSRSGSKVKTKIFICDVKGIQGKFPNKPGIYTKNVVYAEALSG